MSFCRQRAMPGEVLPGSDGVAMLAEGAAAPAHVGSVGCVDSVREQGVDEGSIFSLFVSSVPQVGGLLIASCV